VTERDGGLTIVIPVRGLAGGKSRLSTALSPEARTALAERMLRRVLRVALEAGVATSVVVVSSDDAALKAAMKTDERVIPLRQDAAMPGLIPALDQARRWAIRQGADALLILFGDLPLLAAADVRTLAWADAPVVLAPDRHNRGTNAALLRLGDTALAREFQFQFGTGSLDAHLEEAKRLGLKTATVVSPGTAFDLDTPEDWQLLLAEELVERSFPVVGCIRTNTV
jgi:2-phospho-L-lactate guanylyltransferase